MAKDYEDGVWRTIGGRRVFIRSGQSLSDAMIASGKFKGLKKDTTPSYKQDSEINRDIKHLQAQIDNTRKENERLRRIMNEERQKNGELSDRYLNAEDEYRHNEEYIMRRQNDIAILENRRNKIATQNEFGMSIKQDQLNALRQVGNIEKNQADFENAYIKHKTARENLNRVGIADAGNQLISADLSAEIDYNEMKSKYERMYGSEATREMITRSQETLDRQSLARDGYTSKSLQDDYEKETQKSVKLPGHTKETNLYKMPVSRLRSLAEAYGIDPAGKTQQQLANMLIAMFK